LYKRHYGIMPPDIHTFVRTMADVPMTMKDEVTQILKEKNWKETVIPDPTLLPRMIRKKKE
jgi:acetyl-CoA decarbonylase/synthase complex subunit alpha